MESWEWDHIDNYTALKIVDVETRCTNQSAQRLGTEFGAHTFGVHHKWSTESIGAQFLVDNL